MSQDDDDIPFEVPFHWRVFQFTPPSEEAAGNGRTDFYRLQRNSGSDILTSPLLVDVELGERAQLKLLFRDAPIYFNEHPTENDRVVLQELMKHLAETLNDDEHDGGCFDQEQATTRAEAVARQIVEDFARLAEIDKERLG